MNCQSAAVCKRNSVISSSKSCIVATVLILAAAICVAGDPVGGIRIDFIRMDPTTLGVYDSFQKMLGGPFKKASPLSKEVTEQICALALRAQEMPDGNECQLELFSNCGLGRVSFGYNDSVERYSSSGNIKSDKRFLGIKIDFKLLDDATRTALRSLICDLANSEELSLKVLIPSVCSLIQKLYSGPVKNQVWVQAVDFVGWSKRHKKDMWYVSAYEPTDAPLMEG